MKPSPMSRVFPAWLVLVASCGVFACDCGSTHVGVRTPTATRGAPQTQSATDDSEPVDTAAGDIQVPSFSESTRDGGDRIVAIGDLHGDVSATREVLQLAGAIDENDRWVGDDLVVVQTGDQLDRGDDEREILELLFALKRQAKQAGGALHVLLGNHETMNVLGDFRYVTRGGFADFSAARSERLPQRVLSELPPHAHARASAFFPGGSYSTRLAEHPLIVVVGDTVFAHGGVLLEHVKYGIDKLNRQAQNWLLGKAEPPRLILTPQSPVWTRAYSGPMPTSAACAELAQVLHALHAERMVVGHTIQRGGISSACQERVWRIDVGMSSHYLGDSVAALEIEGDDVEVLERKKAQLP